MPRWRGEHTFLPFVASSIAVLVAVVPRGAQGAERPRLVELEWVAPAGCPTGEEVIARVEDLVGRAQPPGHRTVSARGRVTRSPTTSKDPRFRLELVIVGNEANKRSVSGDDCSHLIDAAALILALDIDPDVLARREEEGQAAPEGSTKIDGGFVPPLSLAPTPPDGPASLARAPAPTLPRSRRVFHLEGGARAMFDGGSLPRPTLGVGAVIALSRGPFMLEVQGTLYQEQFSVVGPRRGSGGAYISLSAVSAHACWRALALHVDWRGCAGGELGGLSTRGVSLAQAESSSGLWSAVSAMVSARVLPRATVSPTAGVAVAHPVGSPPVFIEGFGTVYEPSVLAVRCFLGLDVLFF